jgi:hypothetical protein
MYFQGTDIKAQYDIKRAKIDAADSGDNTLVAAVTGKKIKVLGLILIAADAVNVRFEDGAGGTALTGLITLSAATDGFVLPQAFPGYHWMETTAATLLNLELSSAVQVSGLLLYYEDAE